MPVRHRSCFLVVVFALVWITSSEFAKSFNTYVPDAPEFLWKTNQFNMEWTQKKLFSNHSETRINHIHTKFHNADKSQELTATDTLGLENNRSSPNSKKHLHNNQ